MGPRIAKTNMEVVGLYNVCRIPRGVGLPQSKAYGIIPALKLHQEKEARV